MKEKIAFDTEEDALKELRRIVDTQYKFWKRKPTRAYKDPRDGKYYLTSSPNITTYK